VPGSGDSTPGGTYVTSVIEWIGANAEYSFEFGWRHGTYSPVLAEGLFVQGEPNRLSVVDSKRKQWKDYFSNKREALHFSMPLPWEVK
jgi:hypothetical protein